MTAIETCDRFVDSGRFVPVCSDACRCTSSVCDNCGEPLDSHRAEVREAWLEGCAA